MVALQITWFDLIVTFVMHLPERKHVLAIFFDLEKAYDTTWKHVVYCPIFTTLIFEAVCLLSLMGFCPTDFSR